MKAKPTLLNLYQTVRTMISDLNNVKMSEDRLEEIHDFYVRYSNIDSKYLLTNCVQRPVFDDPSLYVFFDSMVQLESAYQRFETIGTIEDSK